MSTASSFPTVGHVAFATVTASAIGAIAATVLAATAVTPVAMGAFGVLAVTLAGVNIASISAWTVSETPGQYFKNIKDHAGTTIGGILTFAAHVFTQALIQGGAAWIFNSVSGGGPQQTVNVVYKHE